MWMTFFGNNALHMILVDGTTSLASAVAADTSVALFQFFGHLPWSSISSLLATVLVVTFFVTSSDSGSLVVDMLTSGGTDEDTPVWQRIFWSVTEGCIAAALLVAGGLSALQTATIASALPFAVVMLLMCWGLLRALRIEVVRRVSLRDAMLAPRVPHRPVSWEQRLSRIIHQPNYQEVMQFMNNVVDPCLKKVETEFTKRSLTAKVERDDLDRIWIEVDHGDEQEFFYSIHARPYTPPSFVVRDTSTRRSTELQYYRAEVYLKEGGQDYDIMGWTEDQVIADVIDQYEKHMHFLHTSR